MGFTFERLHHVQIVIPIGGEDVARGYYGGAARAHPGVLVNDLESLAGALKNAGRPVEWDPHFPGHRRLYSRDDHGNRLEFLERLTD